MKFKYRSKISLTSFFFNFVVIIWFFYLILNSNKFESFANYSKVQAYDSKFNMLNEDISDGFTINVNDIYIDNDLNWVIYYIVQDKDTLSNIASDFWVTVSHIKKVNKLKSDIIKPWQKLTLTAQEWFTYISQWETISELAKKFNISKEDILDANSLNIDEYKFSKWDEIFIAMSEEQYKKFFEKEKQSESKLESKPKSKSKSKQITYITNPNPTHSNLSYDGKSIVYKSFYNANIINWFYKWHCTWYVAAKKFPYITKNKQQRLWLWNANEWYINAKNAWYSVWQTPKIWSIIVIKNWWRNYYYAWHVAIVIDIDFKNKKILIEEMNAIWKFIVTKRWISMYNNIIWYIYL